MLLFPLLSLCLFTTPIIITLMTSQWPSVFSLFKRLSLSCPPPPQPSEISWHPRVPAAVSHTNIRDVGPFVSPSGVIWGRNGEEVHWKMERKRKEVDGARNKRRPKICFGVCGAWMFFFFFHQLFFSSSTPHFTHPSTSFLLKAAYWFYIRPELPSGCFSFLCFYKARRAQRDRAKEKKEIEKVWAENSLCVK